MQVEVQGTEDEGKRRARADQESETGEQLAEVLFAPVSAWLTSQTDCPVPRLARAAPLGAGSERRAARAIEWTSGSGFRGHLGEEKVVDPSLAHVARVGKLPALGGVDHLVVGIHDHQRGDTVLDRVAVTGVEL